MDEKDLIQKVERFWAAFPGRNTLFSVSKGFPGITGVLLRVSPHKAAICWRSPVGHIQVATFAVKLGGQAVVVTPVSIIAAVIKNLAQRIQTGRGLADTVAEQGREIERLRAELDKLRGQAAGQK